MSGGVAAPSVSASLSAVGFAAANTVSYVAPTLGAWLGYTSASAAAAVGSTAAVGAAAGTAGSVGAFSAVSGAAGAGVAGYKMTRRTAGVRAFGGGVGWGGWRRRGGTHLEAAGLLIYKLNVTVSDC